MVHANQLSSQTQAGSPAIGANCALAEIELICCISALLRRGLLMTFSFHSLLSQSNATGSRSSALTPLQWGMGIILTAFGPLLYYSAPFWILASVVGAFLITTAVWVGSYIFLLAKDRDALRSEQYTLSKMAIEKGLVGDNVVGLHRANVITSEDGGAKVALSSPRKKEEGP